MADIIVGPEQVPGTGDFGGGLLCDLPPVLFGTGTLYLVEDFEERDVGNFSSVDLVEDGSVERVFLGSSEVPSPLGITSSWRLILTGDSYSVKNLSRMLNELIVVGSTGDALYMETVRSLRTYVTRFVKDVSGVCDPGECLMEIIFWRAYFDLQFTYTFSQDEPTIHVVNLIALPDASQHPNNPFGLIQFSCPSGEATVDAPEGFNPP